MDQNRNQQVYIDNNKHINRWEDKKVLPDSRMPTN